MARVSLCVIALVLGAFAEEPIVAELSWEPGFFGRYDLAVRPWAAGGPAGVKVPVVAARFITLRLAGTTDFHVAFDKGLEQAFGDRDTDGDIAEEHALLVGETGSVTLTAELPPTCGVWLSPSDKGVKVATKLHRHGTVVVAGRVRPIKLVDGNGDLLFDDPEKDRAYLDLGGDGGLDRKSPSAEHLRIGQPFVLRGRAYSLHVVDPLGHRVELRPAAARLAAAPLYFETIPLVSRWTRDGKLALAPAEYRRRYGSPKRAEREAALRGAAHNGDKAAALFLEAAANTDKVDDVQEHAARMMGYLPAPFAAFPARLALEHEDPNVRRRAIYALHRMNAPKRLQTYAKLLAKFPNPKWKSLWKNTAKLTAMIGTKASRRTLLKAMRKTDDFAARNSLYDMATHGDPDGPPKELLVAATADASQELRAQGLIDLWILRDSRVRALAIKVLRGRKLEYRLEEAAIRVLASEADAEAVRTVLKRIGDASDSIYARALRLVRDIRDPGALEAFRKATRDRSARVRMFAAEMIAGVPSAENVVALASALKSERDPQAQAALAEALGDLGDPAALPVLLALAARGHTAATFALARVAPEAPEVQAVFAKLLASGKAADRVVALRALGARAPAEALAAALADAEWPVRIAAVAGLRGRREKASVDALVGRLAAEETVRVRWAIADALRTLTGKGIGPDAAAWSGWWRSNRATFRIPEKAPPTGVEQGRTAASFFGLPVQSDRVCFVIDASGSMGDQDGETTRLDKAKAQVRAALERLDDSARVNVVFFDDDVRAWRRALTPLSAASRKSLDKFLDDRKPGSTTNLFDALRLALSQRAVDTVFVLSDGAPTAGEFQSRRDVLRAIRRLNRTRNIAVHGVAVGVDSKLLRLLAEEHGGRYVRK